MYIKMEAQTFKKQYKYQSEDKQLKFHKFFDANIW